MTVNKTALSPGLRSDTVETLTRSDTDRRGRQPQPAPGRIPLDIRVIHDASRVSDGRLICAHPLGLAAPPTVREIADFVCPSTAITVVVLRPG